MPSIPATMHRPLIRVTWLLAAILVAFGGAGIVAGADHQPSDGGRPELTWSADQAIGPGLTAAVGDLDRISQDLDSLGALGREALAALTRREVPALSAAIDHGSTLASRIDAETQALGGRLEALPGGGPAAGTSLGPAMLARYDAVVGALSATGGLATDWSSLARGALSAIQLSTLLADHDRQAGDAARLGSKGDYKGALAGLDKADATLATARHGRDTLANASDVSTLTLWIDRNAAMDTALRALYTALTKSAGQATADVIKALDAVKQAKANLPPDTRALGVIMAELARGGLNQAVISIEDARGQLAAALEQLIGGLRAGSTPSQAASPSGSPSVVPGVSPSASTGASAASPGPSARVSAAPSASGR